MLQLKKVLTGTAVFVLLLVLSTCIAYAEGTKVGVISTESLNVREKPDTASKVLTQLSNGAQVTIVGSAEGWYKITYGNITGWASSKFITVKRTVTGIVNGDDVNLRSKPDTSSDVVAKLNEGDRVSVISRAGNWLKVSTSSGNSGWVHNSLVTLNESNSSRSVADVPVESTPTQEPKDNGNTSKGQEIVNYAKKLLGVKYVYGGTSPKGFDCSGFTQYVYNHFGVSLNRVAADQAKNGTKVAKADLKPGDLVFFDTDGGHNYICHVGIYIGGGKFIHASSGRTTHRVTISELDDGFYNNAFMTARRIVK